MLGEAAVNWKEHTRVCTNKLLSQNNSDNEEAMVAAGFNNQSFKATLKLFLKSHFPDCAGRMQMNYMRNYLKKSENVR